MASQLPLGCAQNLDGSLKEAHEIEWRHSRSPSPISLAHTADSGASSSTTQLDLDTQCDPSHGKVAKERKKPIPGTRPKEIHPRRVLSAAVEAPKKRNRINLHDRIQVIQYWEKTGATQEKVAEYFRAHGFPKMDQSSVSRILTAEKKLRKMALDDPAKLAYARARNTKHPAVEKILWSWQMQQQSAN